MSQPAPATNGGAPPVVVRPLRDQIAGGEGVVVSVAPAADFERVRDELHRLLGQVPGRWQGHAARLDLGDRDLELFDVRRLVHLLKGDYGIAVTAVYTSERALHRYVARELKLQVFVRDPSGDWADAPVGLSFLSAGADGTAVTEAGPQAVDTEAETEVTDGPAVAVLDADGSEAAAEEVIEDLAYDDEHPSGDACDDDEFDAAVEDDAAAAGTAAGDGSEAGAAEAGAADAAAAEDAAAEDAAAADAAAADAAAEDAAAEDAPAELPVEPPPVSFGGGRRVQTVMRSLRGGQSVRFPGDIVIFGDVNPGAVVEAGGHILVFGALRGLAHAGSHGDASAVILAFELRPTQLRIAGRIAYSGEPGAPEKESLLDSLGGRVSRALVGRERTREGAFSPEIAWVAGDTIHIEVWQGRLPGLESSTKTSGEATLATSAAPVTEQ